MKDRGPLEPRFFARKTLFCFAVRISGSGERTHPALLLPDGLDQFKEFRFGVCQPLPASQIWYRKDRYYFLISKYFFAIYCKDNLSNML